MTMRFLLISLFASLFLSFDEAEIPLTITITNVKTMEGNIRIGIYKADNDFPNEKDTYTQRVYKINGTGTISLKIKDLPYGKYGIALYHDENKNGTLDKNFVGAPKEPFAFSNNIKPKFSAPTFEDCAIQYSSKEHLLNVKLLNY